MARIHELREIVRETVEPQRRRLGTIYAVHGDRIDVRIGGSPNVLRGLPVIGGTDDLAVGDRVVLGEVDGTMYAESTKARAGSRAITTSAGGSGGGGGGLSAHSMSYHTDWPSAHAALSYASAHDPKDHNHQSGGGEGGKLDHGAALNGLADDDHTIYSLVDGTRAFTGVVSGVTPTADAHLATKGYIDDEISSISLDHDSLTNVTANQHHNEDHASRHHSGGADELNHDNLAGFVSNEHINHAYVSMTAGNGLTGGGTIAASRTFAVGAGNGIAVSADAVSVDLAAGWSGLEFYGGDLRIDEDAVFDWTSQHTFGGGLKIPDNQAIVLGTSDDCAIIYDESGDDRVEVTGADWLFGNNVTVAGALAAGSGAFTGSVDITGGDLTVGTNILVVSESGSNVGINCSPDAQFDLDVAGNLRAQGWIVGKHAIQLEDALMICHYDGPEPLETNHTGNSTGHMGQIGEETGGVIYTYGKFGKAVQVAEPTTNLIEDGSFEYGSLTAYWDNWGTPPTRELSTSRSYYGDRSVHIVTNGNNQGVSQTLSLTNGYTYTATAYAYCESGSAVLMVISGSWHTETTSTTGQWERLTITFTASTSTVLYLGKSTAGSTGEYYFDCVQVENKSYSTPYCDGSLGPGHEFSGTEHGSSSTREQAYVEYDLSLKAPFSVGCWVSPAWDVSSMATGQYGDQRIIHISDASSNELTLYFNDGNILTLLSTGDSALTQSGISWNAHDWHQVFFTVGSDGSAALYIDSVEVDTGTFTNGAARTFTSLTVGPGIAYYSHRGWVDELVVVTREMADTEIRAVYESNAPVFAETSTWQWRSTNNLIWADSAGLWARDEDGYASMGWCGIDGKSWGSKTLDKGDFLLGRADGSNGWMMWDASEGRMSLGYGTNTVFRADSDGGWLSSLAIGSIGDQVFSKSNGLLLLVPNFRLVPTSSTTFEWSSPRGQIAYGTGPLHTEAGRWVGTRSVVLERATVNYCIAPRMKENGTSGVAYGWTYSDNFGSGGSCTVDIVPHPIEERGWMQRLSYTASAGDSDDYAYIYDYTVNGSFAQNDWVTVTADFKGTHAGCNVRLQVREFDSGSGGGSYHYSDSLTLTSEIQRVMLIFQCNDSDCSKLQITPIVFNVDNGDSFDVYVGAVQVEKYDHATSFCCGSLGWCTWNGTEDDSRSERSLTDLQLDNYVDIYNGNTEFTILMWARMPFDYDTTYFSQRYQYLMMLYGGDGIAIEYDNQIDEWVIYYNGGIGLSADGYHEAGDEVMIGITFDYTNDEYKLYLDGVLADTSTDPESPLSGLTSWTIGSNVSNNYFSNIALSSLAVLDSVLTAEEIGALYVSGHPLVDQGSMDKPGIYVLDGRFQVASSLTGSRVEMIGAGFGVYSDTGTTSVGRILGGFVDTSTGVLDETSTDLGWFGYDASNNMQVAWYATGSNAGKLLAGGGDVWLDQYGIGLEEGTGSANTISWWDGGYGATHIGSINAEASSYNFLNLTGIYDGSGPTYGAVNIEAQAGVGSESCALTLYAGPTRYGLLYGDLRVSQGLYVGAVGTNPDDDDVWCDGEISTDGGTTKWDLGGYTGGAPTADGYVEVVINGTTYQFLVNRV